jgi:hypothetical protein
LTLLLRLGRILLLRKRQRAGSKHHHRDHTFR